MEQKIKIYLNYLSKDEKERMTKNLDFLLSGDKNGVGNFIEMTNRLYGEEVKLDFLWDNGKYPHEWRANYGELHFYTIMLFEKKHLTEQSIKELGSTDSSDFPYHYAISLCKEDRKVYLVSFSDRFSPNWNLEYRIERYIPLYEIDFPILRKDGVIYKMDNALHSAINSILYKGKSLFKEDCNEVRMIVRNQHGDYCEISGHTTDEVFRDYADNYTGYRNYRRQMASEWEIADEMARDRFEQWKKTAKGLKSDFDKFYGGGIVD